MADITVFERAQIRLQAQLLKDWGKVSSTPEAKNLVDRLPVPWNLSERMQYAKKLADWAIEDSGHGQPE